MVRLSTMLIAMSAMAAMPIFFHMVLLLGLMAGCSLRGCLPCHKLYTM